MSAEAAERDADRALLAARQAVKEAREHVKRLEREAAEEARLAKIKMKQAGDLGKRGKMLGREYLCDGDGNKKECANCLQVTIILRERPM